MSGLFNTFSISKRGMQAQQTALHVTSHNVSNANTEGYSVQRVDLKTTQPFGMPSLTSSAGPGQLGTGVHVAKIARTRDEFLDVQIRKEKSTYSKFEAREEFLTQIETIYMEPSDTGLSKIMDNFWNSWQQLSTTPESSTAKTMVVQNGQALANSINHIYGQLENLEVNTGDIIKEQVFEVNSILTQIKDLNAQIKGVTIGGKIPNDLMDRRDLLVDQLSERFSFDIEKTDFNGIKINAKTEEGLTDILSSYTTDLGVSYINNISHNGSDWQIEVYINGDVNNKRTISGFTDDDMKKYLKDEDIASKTVTSKKLHTVFYDNKANTIEGPASFVNGSINGYETIKNDIAMYKEQLNNVAKVFAISINTIHSDNGLSLNFFDQNAEGIGVESAKLLKVNQDIIDDVKKLNAAKVIGGNAGDGERALLIGQIRNTRIDVLDIKSRQDFIDKTGFGNPDFKLNSSTSGSTIDNYYKDTISMLGISNQEAKRMVINQGALTNQLEMRRESISGVSLDEEMTNMLQFQRAYEANSKMISVLDELLNVVVNGLKR